MGPNGSSCQPWCWGNDPFGAKWYWGEHICAPATPLPGLFWKNPARETCKKMPPRNKTWTQVMTWVNLSSVMLNERSPTQKVTWHTIPFTGSEPEVAGGRRNKKDGDLQWQQLKMMLGQWAADTALCESRWESKMKRGSSVAWKVSCIL